MQCQCQGKKASKACVFIYKRWVYIKWKKMKQNSHATPSVFPLHESASIELGFPQDFVNSPGYFYSEIAFICQWLVLFILSLSQCSQLTLFEYTRVSSIDRYSMSFCNIYFSLFLAKCNVLPNVTKYSVQLDKLSLPKNKILCYFPRSIHKTWVHSKNDFGLNFKVQRNRINSTQHVLAKKIIRVYSFYRVID